MKKTPRKIQLTRETLGQLDEDRLPSLAGGKITVITCRPNCLETNFQTCVCTTG